MQGGVQEACQHRRVGVDLVHHHRHYWAVGPCSLCMVSHHLEHFHHPHWTVVRAGMRWQFHAPSIPLGSLQLVVHGLHLPHFTNCGRHNLGPRHPTLFRGGCDVQRTVLLCPAGASFVFYVSRLVVSFSKRPDHPSLWQLSEQTVLLALP